MPRNPEKKRCDHPTCRAWAMRGRIHCRSHLDHELGPRHAGAPKGNVNALKTGKYAKTIRPKDIDQLASLLLLNPERFTHHIAQTAASIHGRSDDTYKTIILFRRLLVKVETSMAQILYDIELQDALERLPAERRPGFKKIIAKYTRKYDPQKRLIYLRAMVAKLFEKNNIWNNN